jgi:hypothetical protein
LGVMVKANKTRKNPAKKRLMVDDIDRG